MVLENLVCRPDLDEAMRASVELRFARTLAQLGEIDEARPYFKRNLETLKLLEPEASASFLVDGTWFFAQAAETEEAVAWAEATARFLGKSPDHAPFVAWERSVLNSLGGVFLDISRRLLPEHFQDVIASGPDTDARCTRMKRRFDIMLHDSVFHVETSVMIACNEAQQLLCEGQTQRALEKLDSIGSDREMSENEVGPVMVTMLQGLSVGRSDVEVQKLNESLLERYLFQGAFTVASCIELSSQNYLIQSGQNEKLVKSLLRKPLFSKLSMHAQTREALETMLTLMRSGASELTEEPSLEEKRARQGGFFGTMSSVGEVYKNLTSTEAASDAVDVLERVAFNWFHTLRP